MLRYFLVNAYNYLNEIFCFNFPTAIDGSLRISISAIKGYKINIRGMIKILFLFSGFYVRFILNILFSSRWPDCSCFQDVGRWVWYSFQHQIPSEQTVCAWCYHIRTTQAQALRQGSAQWIGEFLVFTAIIEMVTYV